ncbi:MAG: glycosyltransferase family 9 protein [Pirellulaceae bacterium]
MPEREYDAAAFPPFQNAVQAGKFDLAIQMHGSGSIVNDLVRSFGARFAAGFDPQESRHAEREAFLRYPEHEHEIWRHLRLVEFLGVPPRGDSLEFPITPADEAEFRELRAEQGLSDRPYICIHPGARYPSRRWPADRFAAVADSLARRGLGVVLTGAPSERTLAAAVSQAMTQPHVDLAGRTSLGALAVCLARSSLLLCNDTGVSHVAAALCVPSVVLVTGSDPRRWAPLDHKLHRVVLQPAACRPCEHRTCPIDFHCASSITPAHVLNVVEIALRLDRTNPFPETPSVLQRSLACAD